MARLYLTSHGETEWKVEGRLQGRQNSLLTKMGREQAGWLANKMSELPLDLIISSPSPRTVETAEIIREQREIPIVQDEHFLEMNIGQWDGLLKEDIEKYEPERFRAFCEQPHLFKADTGEDYYQVRERVLPWLKHILSDYKNQNILIVSHNIVLKVILGYFEKKPIERLWEGGEIWDTSLTVIELENENGKILSVSDTSHFKVIPMKF